MKETGTAHWSSPNTGADNSCGFTALPGGCRLGNGTFDNVGSIGSIGSWWSSTEFSWASAWNRDLIYDHAEAYRYYDLESLGYSVRCVRD